MHFIPIDQETTDHSSTTVFEMEPILSGCNHATAEKEGGNTLPLYSSFLAPLPNEEYCGPSSCFEQPFNDARLEPTPLNSIPDDSSQSLENLIDYGLTTALIPDDSVSSSSTRNDDWKPFTSTTKRYKRDTTSSPSDQQPLSKRQKVDDAIVVNDVEDETTSRFRPHQDKLWLEQFEQLVAFKNKFGHYCVPITYDDDQMLARWVKRQRYQYKRYQDGKPSATNKSRIDLLDSLGFIWDAHAAAWQEKCNELKAYTMQHGHCHIQSHDPQNVKLSTWVKCQRRQYKLLLSGKPSNMTDDRLTALNALGFVWTLRETT